jgi:hypothetical protein
MQEMEAVVANFTETWNASQQFLLRSELELRIQISKALAIDAHFQIYCDVLPKKPAYQRFIARQQLRKYATVLEPLLGSGPRATMEVQLEAMFSMW